MSSMITRENYEERFLLYADNELSVSEKLQVEQFVAENPDLREEFESLRQCRISPDKDIVFDRKESLLRTSAAPLDHAPVNSDNYEEYLLYYIDGELDEATCRQVIAFGNQHPARLEELMRLQKTVSLPDETIVFPNKALLYRRSDNRKVIWLRWSRIAAAAILLFGIGAWLLYPMMHRRIPSVVDQPSGLVKNDPSAVTTGMDSAYNHQGQHAGQAAPMTGDSQPGSGLAAGDAGKTNRDSHRSAGQQTDGQVASIDRSTRKQAPDGKDQQTPFIPGKSTASSDPAPDHTIAANISPADISLESTADRNGVQANAPGSGQLIAANTQGAGRENVSFATQALTANPDTEAEDDINSPTASPKKHKLRGIFRRVTRVFEKTANLDDPDEKHTVLIGSFQFAVK